jgi:hypothetical protein
MDIGDNSMGFLPVDSEITVLCFVVGFNNYGALPLNPSCPKMFNVVVGKVSKVRAHALAQRATLELIKESIIDLGFLGQLKAQAIWSLCKSQKQMYYTPEKIKEEQDSVVRGLTPLTVMWAAMNGRLPEEWQNNNIVFTWLSTLVLYTSYSVIDPEVTTDLHGIVDSFIRCNDNRFIVSEVVSPSGKSLLLSVPEHKGDEYNNSLSRMVAILVSKEYDALFQQKFSVAYSGREIRSIFNNLQTYFDSSRIGNRGCTISDLQGSVYLNLDALVDLPGNCYMLLKIHKIAVKALTNIVAAASSFSERSRNAYKFKKLPALLEGCDTLQINSHFMQGWPMARYLLKEYISAKLAFPDINGFAKFIDNFGYTRFFTLLNFCGLDNEIGWKAILATFKETAPDDYYDLLERQLIEKSF